MALRKIVVQGDECLTKVCRPVTEFNAHLHHVLDDMTETLADANGAGLAAPQVGVLRRVCVVLDEASEEFIELINPRSWLRAGSRPAWRAASACPASGAIVTRPDVVRVRAQDRDGAWFEVEGEGPDGPGLLPRDRASGRFTSLWSTWTTSSPTRSSRHIWSRRSGRPLTHRRGSETMRILFMGTPEFAVASLRRLVEAGHEVCGVFTSRTSPKIEATS